MQISRKFADDYGPDRLDIHPLESITIHLNPGDDPSFILAGLVTRGRLEALLQVLGAGPSTIPAEDFAEILTRFAWVADLTAERLQEMQLAARATHGMGWGTIATAVSDGMSRETVKGQIQRYAERAAEDYGVWYDSAGVHTGTSDEARQALADARSLPRPPIAEDDE